jgi:hypothetical protein
MHDPGQDHGLEKAHGWEKMWDFKSKSYGLNALVPIKRLYLQNWGIAKSVHGRIC